MQAVPETDWRLFRALHEVALARFCERVLGEAMAVAQATSRTPHERYLDLFALVRRRDDELARALDDPARSRMLDQLAAMRQLDLLTADEYGRFSEDTRRRVELLTGAGRLNPRGRA